jgi:peptide/nickel transport system permease protein
VLVTLGVGQSIVWASSLSYLGLGAVPPTAEWGAMLSAGRTYITSFWWMTFFPGVFIVLSAAATTILGRSLQQRVRST